MSKSTSTAGSPKKPAQDCDSLDTYVTFALGQQLFGVPVLKVQDILTPERIAPIPLAPSAVRGAINLRGRIVTVIDVRTRLRLPARIGDDKSMGVTVEHGDELCTLLVDRIGDVISVSSDGFEASPSMLDPIWRNVADGIFRLDSGIMVLLNIDRLLDLSH